LSAVVHIVTLRSPEPGVALDPKLIEVRCATTSCRATVERDRFGAAEDTHAAILHAEYEPNGAVEIALPEPSNREATYRATAVFDCEAARAELQ
jgi:hypothetical protein